MVIYIASYYWATCTLRGVGPVVNNVYKVLLSSFLVYTTVRIFAYMLNENFRRIRKKREQLCIR